MTLALGLKEGTMTQSLATAMLFPSSCITQATLRPPLRPTPPNKALVYFFPYGSRRPARMPQQPQRRPAHAEPPPVLLYEIDDDSNAADQTPSSSSVLTISFVSDLMYIILSRIF